LDELLPPVAPGEKRKEGLFKRLFSKKEIPVEVDIDPSSLKLLAQNAPPKLEDMPITQEMDMTKLRQQLGLGSILEQQAPSPPPQLQNLQSTLADLKPRYTPAKLPEMPHLTANPTDYKPVDFTKDLTELPTPIVPKKEIVPDYKIIKKEIKPASLKQDGFDWTQEFDEAEQKEMLAPKTIIKDIPLKKTLKSLEPDLMDKFEGKYQEALRKKTKEITEGGLEKELNQKISEPQKIDFTQEPAPIEKQITRPQEPMPEQKKPEVILVTPVIEEPNVIIKKDPDREINKIQAINMPSTQLGPNPLVNEPPLIAKIEAVQTKAEPTPPPEQSSAEPSSYPTKEEEFLSQPALKFTMELKEKLKDQVRDEERAKLFKELDDEKAKFQKEKAELEQQKSMMEKLAVQKQNMAKIKEDIAVERALLQDDKEESKKIKADLAKIKQEYKDWQSRVKEINDKIDINKRIEENLADREKALQEAQEKLGSMEHLIREHGFSDFLETELKQKEIEYPEYNGKEDDLKEPHGEVFVLADQCRNLIWQNKLDEAKGIYMQAREMYHGMLANGDQNEQVYMLIRELYDDLNLAILKD
jgi:hypothetical protein